MDKRELEIIQELMEKLQDEMEFSEGDLSDRLGRKKPEMEVVKIEGELPAEDEMEVDPDESPEMSDMMPADESPEDALKRRLMKLRE